jgi:RHS repeat-associated protein
MLNIRAPFGNSFDYSPFGVVSKAIEIDGRTLSYEPPTVSNGTPTIIYQHKFDDSPSTHPYTTTPDNLDPNLTNVSWTNTRNSWTNYAGHTGRAIAINSASADTTKLFLNLTVNEGYLLDVTSYSFYHRSSQTGYTNYHLYINNTLVGSGAIWVTSGTSLQHTGTVAVSNALAGLSGNITVRFDLFGGSNGSNGTFRMDDFVLNGFTTAMEEWRPMGYRYGFNSMEKDDEVKGHGNSYDFGARMYDSRVGRFLSRDPREKEFPFMSVYCFAGNNPIKYIDLKGGGPDDPVRLFIASQNNKFSSDSYQFWNAAYDLQQWYGNKYGWSGVEKIKKAWSATAIVNLINGQGDNSIASLDVFSHSSPQGIWFYHNANNKVEVSDDKFLSFEYQVDNEYNGLYRNEESYESEPGIKKNMAQLSYAKVLKDINFKKFAKNARIEFHGCETAGKDQYQVGFEETRNSNLCIDFSKLLYEQGKTDAVVIGHIGASGPKSGTNDYRQGHRGVFWNGRLLFETNSTGEIKQEEIEKAIQNFKENEKN